MPDSNTKTENFKRLAEARTNKIIDMIELLGNLSNRTNYTYTEEQIELIFSSIESALKESKSRFRIDQSPKKKRFRL